MKQRYSSLDLKVIANELSKTITNFRLSNIYDISSRIFLLRFALPEQKHLVVLDSGFRIHLTTFARETSPSPSSFVSKLRKHLKTRRLTSIRQVGDDRVLELSFSDGNYRLYLEFFAGGNVILTDREGLILAVLRIVNSEKYEYKVGGKYNVEEKPVTTEVKREEVVEALESVAAQAAEAQEEQEVTPAPTPTGKGKPGAKKQFKKSKKKVEMNLKKVLSSKFSRFNPTLIEHCLFVGGLPANLKVEDVLKDPGLVEKVVVAMQEAQRIVNEVSTSGNVKGYIVSKNPTEAKAAAAEEAEPEEPKEPTKKGVTFGEAVPAEEDQPKQKIQADGYIYDDFHPFLPKQLEGVPGVKLLPFDGLNKTVDEFFSSIESQKLTSRLKERELAAQKRLDAVRNEQQRRIDGLRQMQSLNVRKAQAIEANADRVEEAISAVNTLVGQGMDWGTITRMLESEKKRRNPLAELIELPLKLHENKITLRLGEAKWDEEDEEEDEDADETDEEDDSDEESDEEDKKTNWLKIDVDLHKTSYANARSYYDEKRSAADKEDKTLASAEKAIKATERKVSADLKKGLKTEKALLKPVRQTLWFEKFYWFISTEGYLVVGGRDAQQTDLLFRRFWKKGDVFVHADLDGAVPLMIKNTVPDQPISPSTLSQAGTYTICTSKAWDSKQITSAYWVEYEQVSKKDQLGEHMAVGTFRILGNKNFLPPAQLVLGYALLWLVEREGGTDLNAISQTIAEQDEPETFEDIEKREAAEAEAAKGKEKVDVVVANEDAEETNKDESAASEQDKPVEKTEAAVEDEAQEKESPEEADEEEESASTPAGTETPSIAPSVAGKQKPKQLPRGKRAKAKRAKEKYALQDEEERKLAMELLGSAPKPGVKSAAEIVAEKTAQAEAERLNKERRRQQHLSRKSKASGADADTEEDHAQSTALLAHLPADLAKLTPNPAPTDNIIDVIPITVPWSTAMKYKHKIKLQPGTQKKGKAVREIMERLSREAEKKSNVDIKSLDPEKFWPREVELIKMVKTNEVVAGVPVGNLRVSLPGRKAGGGLASDKGKSTGKGKKK
ncbi:hypothetical protein BJ508DRAFT_413882 [Ascobolus immersus RN42]|uniref:Ribosome quality control complex subunit 2 n=1 Tax=Ascobolus immersus RN42 TaxID=1160509 RepID=A0A3N4IB54_ASCIM|nr:hypothetical protein BJ508DRAFT_413882 [Ascobolus immersus RN42]